MGPSNIPAWALEGSISVIAEPLCFLINAFLNEGKFPSDLKQAHVCPIFKKGDTEDPNNYRPTSITAVLSKVFEKVIREQITNYIDNNKFFPGTIWFQEKYIHDGCTGSHNRKNKKGS